MLEVMQGRGLVVMVEMGLSGNSGVRSVSRRLKARGCQRRRPGRWLRKNAILMAQAGVWTVTVFASARLPRSRPWGVQAYPCNRGPKPTHLAVKTVCHQTDKTRLLASPVLSRSFLLPLAWGGRIVGSAKNEMRIPNCQAWHSVGRCETPVISPRAKECFVMNLTFSGITWRVTPCAAAMSWASWNAFSGALRS